MTFINQVKPIDPKSISACILYDASDGSIVHRHEVINFPNAQKMADAEVEANAFRVATQLGYDISKLKALHPSSNDYSSEKNYKVDMKTLHLSEIPAA